MKLKLINFKCWQNKELDLGDDGVTLISGKSGIGKSSILEALYFVLYGIGTKLPTFGVTSCKVELEDDTLNIIRTRRPNILVVDDKYEDDVGQEIINKKYGDMFEMTGYMRQNSYKTFILLSPLEKLAFIERFALKDIDITKIKDKTKELIKERNEKIIGIASKLETTVQILSEMKKLPEVTFPIKCHPKNQEIIIKNEHIHYKNCEKLSKKLSKKSIKLREQLSDLEIFENSQTLYLKNIDKITNNIKGIDEELKNN